MGEQAGSIVTLSHIDLGKLDDLPDAATVHVAKTIRNRKSNCDASCGKDDGGCDNCGSKSKDETPAAQNGADAAAEATAKSSSSAKKGALLTGDSDSPADPDTPAADTDAGKGYSHIVEVEFKSRRKLLYRNEKHLELALGDLVVVEAERGLDAGRVCSMGRIANEKMHIIYKGEEPLHQIVRKANTKDQEKFDQNKASEKEAFSVFRERIKHFELDMKGVDAEWQFDHHRLTLFFTAPRQVDFRSLVRDLAAIFTTRIELRQISPRDEAKRVGGMGICGRELCCSTFLNRFEYITLDHAREQQLAQNPTKLSGLCGRLKCCLLYEIDYYTSALKNYPPLNSTIVTADGGGKMFKIDIFRDEVHLYYAKSGNYGTVSLSDLNNLRRDGKVLAPGQAYVEPPEPEKEHNLDKLDATARKRGDGRRGGRRQKADGEDGKERRIRNKRQDPKTAKDASKAPKDGADAQSPAGEKPQGEGQRSERPSRRRRRGGRGSGGRGSRPDQADAKSNESGGESTAESRTDNKGAQQPNDKREIKKNPRKDADAKADGPGDSRNDAGDANKKEGRGRGRDGQRDGNRDSNRGGRGDRRARGKDGKARTADGAKDAASKGDVSKGEAPANKDAKSGGAKSGDGNPAAGPKRGDTPAGGSSTAKSADKPSGTNKENSSGKSQNSGDGSNS